MCGGNYSIVEWTANANLLKRLYKTKIYLFAENCCASAANRYRIDSRKNWIGGLE